MSQIKTLPLVKESIPDCYKISATQSWLTLIRIVLLIILCLFVETKTDNFFILIPLWFMHGQVMVGLFVLGHDCGHRSFSKNKLTNYIIGHLSFAPLGNGLENWTQTHNHHHTHTQLRGQDVDWSKWLFTKEEFHQSTWRNNFVGKLGYSLPFGVFFWVLANAVGRGLNRKNKNIIYSNIFMWTVMSFIYFGLYWYTGFWGMLKYHLIPSTITMITGYFLLTIQHANEKSKWYSEKSWTPLKGQMDSTFDVRFPFLLEWLWLDINIHIPHHISPGIPWYHLRKASLHLKNDHPELYQERKFSKNEFLWMLKTPFIRFHPDEESYSMVI